MQTFTKKLVAEMRLRERSMMNKYTIQMVAELIDVLSMEK